MAQINKWECDICGKEFEERDGGYANRESINIPINFGNLLGTTTIFYKDTCFNCRENIFTAIQNKIDSIKNFK